MTTEAELLPENMTDKHKAFHLSIMLCCVDSLIKSERHPKDRDGFKRLKALERLNRDIVALTNRNLPKKGFAFDDMQKAHKIHDLINAQICEFYPDNK